MAPSSRIILAILGVTSLGLALCAALIYGSLDRLSLRTAEANVDFVLTQLRDTIEANVSLGLPLSDIRVVQDLIERSKATDSQVLAAEVFSPAGISLFNTDRGSIGEAIAPAWQIAIRYRVANDRWRVEELGNIVVGQVLRNDFDEPVGYLAVTISGEARELHAQAVLTGLLQRMAVVAPVVLLVLLVAMIVIFDLSSRRLKDLATQLASEQPETGGAAGVAAIGDATEAVQTSIDRAVLDFDRATADVLKLDEDEARDAA